MNLGLMLVVAAFSGWIGMNLGVKIEAKKPHPRCEAPNE